MFETYLLSQKNNYFFKAKIPHPLCRRLVEPASEEDKEEENGRLLHDDFLGEEANDEIVFLLP